MLKKQIMTTKTSRYQEENAMPVAEQPVGYYHLRLVFKENNQFIAKFDNQQVRLTPALGCLLTPEAGDLVLASVSSADQSGYILTVLERPGESPLAELTFPGDVSINAEKGEIRLLARDNIALHSDNALTTNAKRWENNNQETICHTKSYTLNGGTLNAKWDNAYWACADTFFTSAKRHQVQCEQSIRHVDGHEEISTQSSRQYVANDWTLYTRSSAFYAEETTSIKAQLLKLA